MSEAFTSIRSNAATTIAAIVTVLIVTVLLGFCVAIGKWAYDYTNGVRSEITVKAYVPQSYAGNGQAATEKRGEMMNTLQALPNVKSIEYVSPEDALNSVSQEQRNEVKQIGYNPLPPGFFVRPQDPSKVQQLYNQIRVIPAVKHCGSEPCAGYSQQITKRVLRTTKYVLVFLGVTTLLLVIAAVVLIQNTIRLSIFSRRREIEVMKLVGATNSFVRLPFMLEGMITGVSGSVFALVLLSFVYVLLNNIESGLTDPVRSVGVFTLSFGLVAFGLILGAFSSAITLRRFLRI